MTAQADKPQAGSANREQENSRKPGKNSGKEGRHVNSPYYARNAGQNLADDDETQQSGAEDRSPKKPGGGDSWYRDPKLQPEVAEGSDDRKSE